MIQINVKGDSVFNEFLQGLVSVVRKDRSIRMIDGEKVSLNPSWIRDHIHEMKGYKHWEKDLSSAIDYLIKHQTEKGFFYEIFMPYGDSHTKFVDSDHVLFNERNNLALVRLELEADIEYLMVEGVYTIWQATGDDSAMKRRLPNLEKGLRYCMTDAKRWSKEYGLIKRPFTIDTWDFTYGFSTDNRRIMDNTPMSIMHGDNSGMYMACLMLAQMFNAVGKTEKVEYWESKAKVFRENTNKICWNGTFYTHQIHLDHSGVPGVDEKKILSLSNTYDINRGLPTHKQAVSIISEYIDRQKLTKDKYFAEWFSIEPPYPKFVSYSAGEYINGGIASFVAGELAKASFNHGFEDYGYDIISRLRKLWQRDRIIYFLYTPEGKNFGGGPPGWGAAAIISAIVEGLAGVKDMSKLYQEVKLSPRWAIAGVKEVKVEVGYGPSNACFEYEYHIDKKAKTILIFPIGNSEKIIYHVLLPKGTEATEVREGENKIVFNNQMIEKSSYVNFESSNPRGKVKIQWGRI